jgi:hypothetical protein
VLPVDSPGLLTSEPEDRICDLLRREQAALKRA